MSAEFDSQTPTSQIKSTFDQHGYIILRNFLSPTEVASVRTELNRYIQDVIPTIPPEHAFYENKNDPTTLKQLPQMQNHDAYFHDLIFGDNAYRQLAELLLEGNVVGKNLQLLRKPPAIGQPTPPHQDGYYFMIEPCEGLTMWLALDEANEENGCLRYVQGSHKKGLRPHARTQTLGFSQGITDYGTNHDLQNEIAHTAQPGDLFVHHALTVHRAEGNNSPTASRTALGFVYLAERAKEQTKNLEEYRKTLAKDLSKQGKI